MCTMNTAISRLLTLLCLTHTLFYLFTPVTASNVSPLASLSHGRQHATLRRLARHAGCSGSSADVQLKRAPSAQLVMEARSTDQVPHDCEDYLADSYATEAADSLTTIKISRAQAIIESLNTQNKTIDAWLSTLSPAGKWPDSEIDYTTGCEARRANWPAQDHWIRISVMAAAWHGGFPGAESWAGDVNLRSKIAVAMDYWFSRDFTGTACLDQGGTATCPCSNPNNWLWNTNWYSNVILIPKLVVQTGVLLGDTMTSDQVQHCITMGTRSYNYNVDGLTGANALDVSRIAMDQALITSDTTLLADAYSRSHKELMIQNVVRSDGIRADGAFGQHDGMLYNGNYGKDYSNDILGAEIDAAGTEYAANATSQSAFGTLFDGNKWMIYRNSITQVLHWDFSAIGRFITFPAIDAQASGSINTNLTSVGRLGQLWGSQALSNFASSLSTSTSHANAGNLIGNKMFYTNDYMVHRGANYVTTVKMYSTRTRQSECTNSQNPLGFHLGDGVVYNYLQGNEYEDISAAWDWNLIPGTTVDYGATPLQCSNNHNLGVEAFVGGASDGKTGASAMRYTNPVTNALKWQKAWFFLDNDVQYVMLSGLSSTSGAPVYSVLDQRRHSGSVYIDGVVSKASGNITTVAKSLWHGNVGYVFSLAGSSLTVDVGTKSGAWSAIGTSEQPPTSVDLFAAYIENNSTDATSLAYAVFPGTTQSTFTTKSSQLKVKTIQATSSISAIFDQTHEVFMATFWSSTGGSVTFTPVSTTAPITLTSNRNSVVIYRVKDRKVIVSEPSQTEITLQIRLVLGSGTAPWESTSRSKTFNFTLPIGGLAGSSLTQAV